MYNYTKLNRSNKYTTMIHRTTQYVPNGEFNRFYSIMPPSMNNSGASLIVILYGISLKIESDTNEVVGLNESRYLLMGNAQTVLGEEVSIDQFIDEFNIAEDDRELVRKIIEERVRQAAESLATD